MRRRPYVVLLRFVALAILAPLPLLVEPLISPLIASAPVVSLEDAV